MTRRAKVLLAIAIVVPVAFLIFAATMAFIVLRTLETKETAPAAAATAFEEVRRSFPARPPLIEVVDLRSANVRVNRQPASPRKPVDKLYFMVWNPGDQEIMRGSAPAWVARMRVSITGIGGWSFSDLHVTMEDIERYAPGIVVDFKTPAGEQVLVWVR